MHNAVVGRALKRCRESVRPPYSHLDLATCVLSPPDPSVAALQYTGGVNALAQIIRDFENSGELRLADDLLGSFFNLCVVCLDAQHVNDKDLKDLALKASLAILDGPDNWTHPYLP